MNNNPSHSTPSNSEQPTAADGDDLLGDLFETEVVEEINFKPGSGITMGDLADMITKNDDGSISINPPSDAVEKGENDKE